LSIRISKSYKQQTRGCNRARQWWQLQWVFSSFRTMALTNLSTCIIMHSEKCNAPYFHSLKPFCFRRFTFCGFLSQQWKLKEEVSGRYCYPYSFSLWSPPSDQHPPYDSDRCAVRRRDRFEWRRVQASRLGSSRTCILGRTRGRSGAHAKTWTPSTSWTRCSTMKIQVTSRYRLLHSLFTSHTHSLLFNHSFTSHTLSHGWISKHLLILILKNEN